ncbi:MAG: type II toxin-antitoxin system ParD family antitoxin [Cyanothece sp. SIO2G6]|nr:type II toxin-antitoxin system ParD family antitoxin [Cyanothece sp. SIO2G6]
MNLPLSPELQQFTEQQISSGKYSSMDDILVAGLQALFEREQIYQGRFDELHREILLAAQEAEQGQLLDASTEITAIRQRLRERYTES